MAMDKISKLKLKWIGYLILEIFIGAILFLVIAILLIIIIASFANEDVELGSGYVYNDEWKDISGPLKREINGSVKYLDIPATILQYAYDDTYIIASQDFTGCSPLYMYDLGEYQNFKFRSIDTDSDGVYYWILFKRDNKNIVCGTENEFVKKCDSIGIADKLVAKIIN